MKSSNQTIEWDEEDKILFKEFNYDLRKPVTPIAKKRLISWRKVDTWLEKFSECCIALVFMTLDK